MYVLFTKRFNEESDGCREDGQADDRLIGVIRSLPSRMNISLEVIGCEEKLNISRKTSTTKGSVVVVECLITFYWGHTDKSTPEKSCHPLQTRSQQFSCSKR